LWDEKHVHFLVAGDKFNFTDRTKDLNCLLSERMGKLLHVLNTVDPFKGQTATGQRTVSAPFFALHQLSLTDQVTLNPTDMDMGKKGRAGAHTCN